MKKSFLILGVSAILALTGCNQGGGSSSNGSSNTERPKTPEELRLELKQQEQSTPQQYLEISGTTMKHNMTRESGLFHDAEYDGWLVEGVIKNSASIAKFKDIVVSISLISQTGTVIEEKDYVIYEFYEPNTTKKFAIKIYPPEVTDKFNVNVKTAVAAE
jgi:hypothetical protein